MMSREGWVFQDVFGEVNSSSEDGLLGGIDDPLRGSPVRC